MNQNGKNARIMLMTSDLTVLKILERKRQACHQGLEFCERKTVSSIFEAVIGLLSAKTVIKYSRNRKGLKFLNYVVKTRVISTLKTGLEMVCQNDLDLTWIFCNISWLSLIWWILLLALLCLKIVSKCLVFLSPWRIHQVLAF